MPETFTITQAMLDAHVVYATARASGDSTKGTQLVVPDEAKVVLADGVTLKDADLRWADLSGAYLSRAYLSGADLSGAYLSGAYLSGAYLSGAYLSGAYLSGAYLSGAYLSGAYLSGAIFAEKPRDGVPVIPHIDAAILAAVEGPSARGTLEMDTWHKCETTHCRAGWAVVLAGEPGRALEKEIGTERAAKMIYEASRPGEPAPHWFAPTGRALADIRAWAAKDPMPSEGSPS